MKKLLDACGGNVSDIARLCAVSPQAAHMWVKRGTVPGGYVRMLCEAYGLTPHDIRPDLFEPGWSYNNAERTRARRGRS